MSADSSDGSSDGSSGSSSDQEQEQHVQQVVTGANADPQVLQYFWDLASLQQVGPWRCLIKPVFRFSVPLPSE